MRKLLLMNNISKNSKISPLILPLSDSFLNLSLLFCSALSEPRSSLRTEVGTPVAWAMIRMANRSPHSSSMSSLECMP